jgi:hypothetical protein
MHTVCDVRNLNLYQGMKPDEIWASYKRALHLRLDRADGARQHAPALPSQPEHARN